MANLDAYTSVRTALFVEIQIDEYRTTSSGSYTSQVLRFSDYDTSFFIDGNNFVPLGEFLSIAPTTNELRPSSNTISIGISGVPTNNVAEIVYSKIKGAPIKIYRAYFNVSTGAQISTTEGKFFGSVNNYSIVDELDTTNRSGSTVIEFECSSNVDTLANKLAGRKTNPQSQQRFYPSDLSMNRVPTLKGTKFKFGAQE